ncbi:MAG TPA: hypothetical protein ENN05_06810 [Deltaproteobacteria bacterium]|nr:hypothetical protein [Deltaproteobacteria bacterium]
MKLKIFTIVFIALIIMLTGSAFMMFSQTQKVQEIDLQVLEDSLYTENIEILSWTMNSIDLDSFGKDPLPASWAEIMVVDNDSLVIISSTNKDHEGLVMYKLPELLDQANPIMDSIKNTTGMAVHTDTYLVAIKPLKDNRSLLGFKPRSWEKGLLAEQNALIKARFGSAATILIVYFSAGLLLSLLTALCISIVVIIPIQKVISAFEELSMGNLDAEIPKTRGKAFESLVDSFTRLRTSLIMALERLGGR